MKYAYLPLICGVLVLAGCGDNNADSKQSEAGSEVTVVADEAVDNEVVDDVEVVDIDTEEMPEKFEVVEGELMVEDDLEDDYVNPDAGIPNVWNTASGQGFIEYYINDAKGTYLRISCNVGAGSEYDHSATLEYHGESYSNTDSEYPVKFLVDDAIEVAAPESTNWRNGGNAWDELAENIAQATKIDAYLHNKKVATFTPSPANVAKVVSDLAECQAMIYQDQESW